MLENLCDMQKLIEVCWELGVGSELDVQSSCVCLKVIEVDILLLEVVEVQLCNWLVVLFGQCLEVLIDMFVLYDVLVFVKVLLLGDICELLCQCVDVCVVECCLVVVIVCVGVVIVDLFSWLLLFGFVGFFGGDVSGLVNGNNKVWLLILLLSWVVFDFGIVCVCLCVSKVEVEGVVVQYEQVVLLVLEDIENVLICYFKQQV